MYLRGQVSKHLALSAICWATLLPGWVLAAGATLYESGSLDMGMASAGRAAIAMDANSAFTNPAGMTQLGQEQISTSLVPLYMRADFQTDNDNTAQGGSGGNQAGWLASASFAYVKPLSDRWALGVAAFTYYGNGLDPNDNWAGRFQLEYVDHTTFNLLPSLAYRVSDNISIGLGLGVQYSAFEEKILISERSVDNIRLDADVDSFEPLFNISFYYTPFANTVIGFNYFGEVSHHFNTDSAYKGPPPPDALPIAAEGFEVDLNVPQHALLSFKQGLSESLYLTGTVAWAEHSRYGTMGLAYEGLLLGDKGIETDLEWDDAWSGAVGLMYEWREWLFTTGFSYDESTTTTATRIPSYPTDDQYRFAVGARRDIGKNMTLTMVYEYASLGEGKLDIEDIRKTRLSGEYKDYDINFFGLSLNYLFDAN